jgi:hypothetical protein
MLFYIIGLLLTLADHPIEIKLKEDFSVSQRDIHLLSSQQNRSNDVCTPGIKPNIKSGIARLNQTSYLCALIDMDANGEFNNIGVDKIYLSFPESRKVNVEGEYSNTQLISEKLYMKVKDKFFKIAIIEKSGEAMEVHEYYSEPGKNANVIEVFEGLNKINTILPNSAFDLKTTTHKYLLFLDPKAKDDSLFFQSDLFWLTELKKQEKLDIVVGYCSFMHTFKTIKDPSHLVAIQNLNIETTDITLSEYKEFLQLYRFSSGILLDKNNEVLSYSINPKFVIDYFETGEINQPQCYINGNCISKECK